MTTLYHVGAFFATFMVMFLAIALSLAAVLPYGKDEKDEEDLGFRCIIVSGFWALLVAAYIMGATW